jgi:uncharacterized membrane protein (DUF485 family)
MAHVILLVFSFVLLLIEAFRPTTWPTRWPVPHLGWLGVSLFVLTFIINAAVVR